MTSETRRSDQCRQFQEDAKDASVSECTWTLSALEALRNALYKFKTYLLTYLLCSLFAFRSTYGSVLYHFGHKANYWPKIASFSYPLHSTPTLGVSVGILPYSLVWKN